MQHATTTRTSNNWTAVLLVAVVISPVSTGDTSRNKQLQAKSLGLQLLSAHCVYADGSHAVCVPHSVNTKTCRRGLQCRPSQANQCVMATLRKQSRLERQSQVQQHCPVSPAVTRARCWGSVDQNTQNYKVVVYTQQRHPPIKTGETASPEGHRNQKER